MTKWFHLAAFCAAFALLGLAEVATAATIEIKWDPNPEPNVTSYRVYIGSAPGKYDRFVDVGKRVTFALTTAEPGKRYYLAVAAVAGADVSEKSNEVVAIGEGAPAAPAPPAPDPGPTPIPDPGIVGPDPYNPYVDPYYPDPWGPYGPYGMGAGRAARLLAGEACANAGPCFRYSQIGPPIGQAGSLSAAADDVLFFVEGRKRVRLIAGTRLIDEPAYVSEAARLEQVIVDPAFARTGLVFVSESTLRRDGTLELSIVRLRYVAGTLGEPARIVTGIPIDEAQRAPFAISPAGLIYVAVPASAVRPSADAGRVLGFTLEGQPVREPRSGALVTGVGLPDPVSMWMEGGTGLLWLAGRDLHGQAVNGVVEMGRRTVFSGFDGDPAAAAGPLGAISIPERTVLATGPANGGGLFAVVGPEPASAGDTVVVKLEPSR